MKNLRNDNTGAASASNINPIKLFALLAVLLCAFALTPAHAQEAQEIPGAMTTININTADASTLAAGLNGVGASRAEDIVRYREEFGAFTTVEQLAEVKGVGKSTLEKNRARITLE
ncbi:MAG: ComEA family DNA-binding protein [Halioglobus sp.]